MLGLLSKSRFQGLWSSSKRSFAASDQNQFKVSDRICMELTAVHRTGSLRKILDQFKKHKLNLTSIESSILDKKPNDSHLVKFSIGVQGEKDRINIEDAIKGIDDIILSYKYLTPARVPWFPKKITDLDLQGGELQVRDEEAARDHPQLKDAEYRARRDYIASVSKGYKVLDPIPDVEYNENENKTWEYVYENLRPLQDQAMASQFIHNVHRMERECGMNKKKIPQLRPISEYLQAETGFRLRPVSGILSQREFLNSLAHRVFCSTQYIRHHSTPEYTPEPDIVHEILGHAPMFADKDFADMSQLIGLYSLGANADQLTRLGALYWYTVEFGACKEGNQIKGYGAGVASSFGEIRHFMSDKPKFEPLDPMNRLPLDFPVQTYQPIFFYGKSFKHMKEILLEYGEYLKKPFKAYYDYEKSEVEVDRPIETYMSAEGGLNF
eukprot:TRINITY_DN3033_c0_g2_i1.p1 TRINITY_DN3033_c0_g2~~TRINITY_DN3033_c0_g2_i1.p1  ORF type:complete len:439 (-),score=77.93 TRINITY_DN3033_c0_g2_i1:154-1470(-)